MLSLEERTHVIKDILKNVETQGLEMNNKIYSLQLELYQIDITKRSSDEMTAVIEITKVPSDEELRDINLIKPNDLILYQGTSLGLHAIGIQTTKLSPESGYIPINRLVKNLSTHYNNPINEKDLEFFDRYLIDIRETI